MISNKINIKAVAGFYLKHEYVCLLLPVLVWQIYLILLSPSLLPDTDNYTHALRLTDFIQSGSWAETMYMHDNHPFGQMLHFTRLTDMFLFVAALPFLPFTSVKQAVWFGCFLYQPLIAALSLAALIQTGKALSGAVSRLFLIVFYFCFPSIFFLFTAGRADHHLLLNLLTICVLGCLMHGFKTQRSAFFKTAGLFAGLSVWATPEGFINTLLITAGLLGTWLLKYENIRQIKAFGLSFFLTCAVCLIANPPMQGLMFADNGRLSILLVAISFFMMLSFYIIDFLEKENFASSFFGRSAAVFVPAFLFFGITLFLFKAEVVLASPIPPELYEIWTKHITELQPALDIGLLTACLFGTITFFFSSGLYKKAMIVLTPAVFFYALATLVSNRFSRTGAVFAVLLFTVALNVIYDRIAFLQRLKPAYRLILTFLCLSPCCFFAFSHTVEQEIKAGREAVHPTMYMPYISKEKGSVLTASNDGPEVAWWSGLPVVGSPYHSNAQGITDAYNILNGEDLDEAQALLKKHRVKTILVDNPYYFLPKELHDKQIFYPNSFIAKAVTKSLCFLKQPDMPENIKRRYCIFHVDFTACEKAPEQSP